MTALSEHVTALVASHSAVTSVELTGSRARGAETPLSDWDFRIEGDMEAIVRDLPQIAAQLDPLMAMWDPLSERAVFMFITQDGVKVDLFPGDETRALQPPWDPGTDDPQQIDGHFWDWTLWLGGKTLGGKHDLVREELVKMHGHLLGPLGAPEAPTSVAEAIECYTARRDPTVDTTLGAVVTARLAEHGLTLRS